MDGREKLATGFYDSWLSYFCFVLSFRAQQLPFIIKRYRNRAVQLSLYPAFSKTLLNHYLPTSLLQLKVIKQKFYETIFLSQRHLPVKHFAFLLRMQAPQ